MFKKLLILALLLSPTPAFAWGAYAHRTIAGIAEQNIDPVTKARMNSLFRSAALLGTPQCDLKNIGDASVWPDCIRRDRLRWNYTSPWHYQNVDICKPFDLKSACRNGNCVSAQIDRNAALLKDKALPAHVRLEALTFLVHFVGDMHMPLHSGDRSDRGGNDVSAAYGAIEGRMNLHWLWDGPLAERAITDGPEMVRVYSAEEKSDKSFGTTDFWAMQAWQIARDYSYTTVEDQPSCGPKLTRRGKVDNDEIRMLIPTARLQIERSGLRLARLLEESLN
ncbi:S1/P1 nuclease [Parasphingorhabdus cellanae]|uniref:S1/P1 nuclease n=1 Tax=Parasphingorhabdus cellanae TaxID=2806553 RepID=A0ABX7T1G9_9SPHN|nr:S1/P1 nuclease [Parasphingorhabdus cellanae]QTD55390.1 S1/P1 nuclease [Parasphingorhabdus cellanae]